MVFLVFIFPFSSLFICKIEQFAIHMCICMIYSFWSFKCSYYYCINRRLTDIVKNSFVCTYEQSYLSFVGLYHGILRINNRRLFECKNIYQIDLSLAWRNQQKVKRFDKFKHRQVLKYPRGFAEVVVLQSESLYTLTVLGSTELQSRPFGVNRLNF